MTTRSTQFGTYFQEHFSERLGELADKMQPITQEGLLKDTAWAAEPSERANRLDAALNQIAQAIETRDRNAMIDYATEIGLKRAGQNWSMGNMMAVFSHMRSYIWEYLTEYIKQHPDFEPADIQAVEEVLHDYQGAYFGSFRGYYEQMQRDMLKQQEELERQHTLVQELGTPIVPLYEGILLIPLVGQINEFRALRVTEQVLESIVEQQADVLLIDITGVPVVDTSIASHIMTLTRAVRLLGTDVIMVGLGAEIAQTIVHLGINLNGIATLANLQDGLVEALRRRGLSIRNGDVLVEA